MNAAHLLTLIVKGKKPRHSPAVRMLHWIYAPAVLTSIFSGFYINNPARIYGFKNMDSARKTHFIAQFALLFSYLARVYYGCLDKNYRELILNRKTLAAMPKFIKHELFLTDKKPEFPKYNPGQKILFTGFALSIPLQIITGLSLYSPNSMQQTAKLAGGLNPLHKLHYMTALAIFSLASGHLYFALTHGLKKLKSIFTGYE